MTKKNITSDQAITTAAQAEARQREITQQIAKDLRKAGINPDTYTGNHPLNDEYLALDDQIAALRPHF